MAVDRLGRGAAVDLETEIAGEPGQQPRAALVDLQRHQPRTHLDDVRAHAQQLQGVGGLQVEQTASEDDAGPALNGRAADRVEVLEGAVGEAPIEVVTGHRRHERSRHGGQHQRVVDDQIVRSGHRVGGAVDAGDTSAQAFKCWFIGCVPECTIVTSQSPSCIAPRQVPRPAACAQSSRVRIRLGVHTWQCPARSGALLPPALVRRMDASPQAVCTTRRRSIAVPRTSASTVGSARSCGASAPVSTEPSKTRL
jgi:hypothetical protein